MNETKLTIVEGARCWHLLSPQGARWYSLPTLEAAIRRLLEWHRWV